MCLKDEECDGGRKCIGQMDDWKENPVAITAAYCRSRSERLHSGTPSRTSTDPETIVASLRNQVAEVDANIPITRIDTLVQRIDKSLVFERMFSRLTGSFGLLALVLVCVGLYGTMSYFVARRTNEIGVRMALGAQPGRVFRMVLVEGFKLTGAGVVVGLAGAVVGARLISSVLYEVPAVDPLTFSLVALLLIGIGLLACYIPARRAMRVDPMVALRYE